MRLRRTARVLLYDAAGRILLVRFSVPREDGPFCFWIPPGGEIEPGETPADAAVRELHEELGLAVSVDGPLYVESNRFLHQGDMQDNTDYLFRSICDQDAPVLSGVTEEEIATMKEIRWWTREEILQAQERIFPVDLAAKMKDCGTTPPSSSGSHSPGA